MPDRSPRDARYDRSPKGRTRSRVYNGSPKGRARARRYEASAKGSERAFYANLRRARERHEGRLLAILAGLAHAAPDDHADD